MAITTVIQNFPPAPDSSTDTEAAFNAKADAFVGHQAGTYVAEVNAWATEANALVTGVNTSETNAKASEVEAKKQADRATAGASSTLPPVAGNANKILEVNSAGTATEWVTLPLPDLTKYLPLAGGHMTGDLTIQNTPTTGTLDLGKVRIQSSNVSGTSGWIYRIVNLNHLDTYMAIDTDNSIKLASDVGIFANGKEVVTGVMNGTKLELYLGTTLVKTIA